MYQIFTAWCNQASLNASSSIHFMVLKLLANSASSFYSSKGQNVGRMIGLCLTAEANTRARLCSLFRLQNHKQAQCYRCRAVHAAVAVHQKRVAASKRSSCEGIRAPPQSERIAPAEAAIGCGEPSESSASTHWMPSASNRRALGPSSPRCLRTASRSPGVS
jgi:hypothetical protein